MNSILRDELLDRKLVPIEVAIEMLIGIQPTDLLVMGGKYLTIVLEEIVIKQFK